MTEESRVFSRRTLMSTGIRAAAGLVGVTGISGQSSAAPSFAKHQIKQNEKGSLRVSACQILTYPEVDRSVQKVLSWKVPSEPVLMMVNQLVVEELVRLEFDPPFRLYRQVRAASVVRFRLRVCEV